ncbi:MAG: CinA family nicotinamide mononucleotide deamidase-related protein [Candidatus Binatia bacterium]
MANAEIVAIGSELLLGQIVDTNSAWMAQRLTAVGVNLFYKTIVGDNPGRMREVLAQALDRSDVVITSGGLGPTQDDLTREVVAEITHRKLLLDPELLEQMEQRFRRHGRAMTPNNDRQAYIPRGAIPVENPNGTAPSFIVEDPRGVVFALPGVPHELKWLFAHEVIPYLQKKFNLTEVITSKVLKVAGVGESGVDDRIGYLIANSSNPTVGVLAQTGQVVVRITAKAASKEEAMRLIEPVEVKIRELLGRHVFATDEETMEDVVGQLLREKKKTVAVFEDQTGGLVTEQLQQAGPEQVAEAMVATNKASMCRLLALSRQPRHLEELFQDPTKLTDELAWAIRLQTKSDYGLALHAEADSEDPAQNLASGKTFISVTNGKTFKNRLYPRVGRGRPERTRASLNAMELLRLALLEGM